MTIEERFDTIQNQLNTVCELLQLSISSLNTKKAVAKFLNKSEKTIDNYIHNNTLIENKHYFINDNKKIEFITFAIVDYKKNPNHKIKIFEVKKEEKIILSKTSTKILKGLI